MAKELSQQSAARSKRKFILQLTGKGMILWLCLIFLVSGWMFVLGVLVGRGTAPVNFDIQAIQNELIALKESMLQKEKSITESDLEKGYAKNTFDFYEALKGKQTQETIEIPPKKEQPESVIQAPPPSKKPAVSSAQAPKKDKAIQPAKGQKEGTFAVQVASTKDPESADELVENLLKKGYPAFSIKADIPEKGTWYRVRVGYYHDNTQADAVRRQLLTDQFEGIIVRR
jgi:cell division septation protein DedD